MKRGVNGLLVVMGVLSIGLASAAVWFMAQAMPIGTGYVAKYLCTNTFLSKRDPKTVFIEDIRPVNPLAKVVAWSVDSDDLSVTATAFKIFKSKAIYRQGCGCTLVVGTTEAALQQQDFFRSDEERSSKPSAPPMPWPKGCGEPERPSAFGVDENLLEKAIDAAFQEPSPDNPRKTRAVAVVYDGHLIAERYTSGFGPDIPILGWSISKSVTNALVGVLVRQGRLVMDDPAPVPEWRSPGDPRGRITLDQLMRMSSGLAFEEVYRPLADATDMLYGSADFAAFAAAQPLDAEPDDKWHYASGSANIVARIVRREAEKDYEHYYQFLHDALFGRIGMTSAVMEADPSGTFVGSSYTVATVRDWARFGLLYLQDGVWDKERLLPEGWVEYTTSPTPQAPKGEYGALFWLNAGTPGDPQTRLWPHAPVDAYAAQGFQEQKVIVVPSKKLVLVRFGATADRSAWDTDAFIAGVIDALPE